MPIILPENLPAGAVLRTEGIEVWARGSWQAVSARPARVALLNLMPTKAVTETQFARLLARGPRTVDLDLLLPDGYESRTTPHAHLERFYRYWRDLRQERFDGLIVTGAPVERLAFSEVSYWPVLEEILEWSRSHVRQSLYICWAGQAALHHFHHVPKRPLPRKLSGIYRQQIFDTRHPLFEGLGESIAMPVSRYTEISEADLPAGRGLTILAGSPESGLALIEDRPARALYLFNHLEYDAETLLLEYRRDIAERHAVPLPVNYFPSGDSGRAPIARWRIPARRLFRNWLSMIGPDSEETPMADLCA